IVSGIIKANVIIGHLPSELIASAKIAGYVSVSISSIISAFVIGLMVGVILLLNIIFEYDIKENDLIDGFRNSIIIFIFFEILKLGGAYLILREELNFISYDDTFLYKLRDTDWFLYDSIVKYLMILVAAIIYVADLYSNGKVKRFSKLTLIFIALLTGYFISTMDYFG